MINNRFPKHWFQKNWFFKIGSKQGIFWGIMIYVVGAFNDVMTRFVGCRIQFFEIAFFRCVFSALTAFIHILIFDKTLFRTKMQKMHICRGGIGAIGLGLCALGVQVLPLAENTTLLFSEAFFILPLAAIFLNEKLSKNGLIATIMGFVGLLVMLRPSVENFNKWVFIPIFSALTFSVLSVILKKIMKTKENNLTMTFYFGVYSAITCSLFLSLCWVTPNETELMFLFLLGCGGSLIQFCIYMAYRSANASDLSSIRYVELVFATIFGYIFFSETIDGISIIGAAIIIFSSICASFVVKTQN